jgi:D-alanine-D-alanine ligase
MDKELMKALFAAADLPQAPYRVLRGRAEGRERERSLVEELGLPLFVKPANMGSSVGVSKVRRAEEMAAALEEAFAYDAKVVVEAGVRDAREIEVSVLGNERPEASLPGEIVPDREFYDYSSKYASDSRTELVIPARLDAPLTKAVQDLGLAAFRAVDAAGYARVDCFLERASGRLLLNEINTIPGFTSISMYPKMWEASGLRFEELLAQLVALGVERQRARARLSTHYGG